MPKLFIVYHILIFKYFVTLHGICFMYHNYVIEIIGCRIFQCYGGSFGSSQNHFTYFFKGVWPFINGSTCCSYLLGMLGYNHFCICHSFPTRRSPSFFSCDDTCQKWHLSLQIGIMEYLNFTISGSLFSSPSLWKSSGTIVSSLLGFFSNYLHKQKFATFLIDVPFKC